MTTESEVHIPYAPTSPNAAPAFALLDAQYMKAYGAAHVEFSAERGYLSPLVHTNEAA